jgi:hypothetical protein
MIMPPEHVNGARKRGRPVGTPGCSKYGGRTKVVRVPEELADDISQILRFREDVLALLDDWDERIRTAQSESKSGLPSPRYERALQLMQELREL